LCRFRLSARKLTEAEIERLMEAAKGKRHATMVLVACGLPARPTGFRAWDLRWDQVDFRTTTLHVRRVERALPARILSFSTNRPRTCGRAWLCLPRPFSPHPSSSGFAPRNAGTIGTAACRRRIATAIDLRSPSARVIGGAEPSKTPGGTSLCPFRYKRLQQRSERFGRANMRGMAGVNFVVPPSGFTLARSANGR
jgi:hypothetical protein